MPKIEIRTLEAWAHIDAMRILDPATGIWYAVFPEGQQAFCHVGETCWLNLRLKNAGTTAGTLYLIIRRQDTGQVIWNQSYPLGVDQYVDIDQINFVMPAYNVSLYFEIGH